ncbi:hypothetical protein IV454_18740 [Massilia antarctica]|uniref:Aminoglycoside phosphotransferase n=1 Tax=Massilia antarctica TaxID=2765360 RepID=A0AA49A5W6_9BURK|nr:hypothetical protein [Massilia antarctica]QPI47626.1 hypothetical protein IV454_18740 [Massilia antarctica]
MEHMTAQLAQLLRQARDGQVVMRQAGDDGLQLLAYPLPDGALVALGFGRDSAHRVLPERVLRRRTLMPARYGRWLPAMLGDGSWYVVRRLRDDASGQAALPDAAQWQAARELLA